MGLQGLWLHLQSGAFNFIIIIFSSLVSVSSVAVLQAGSIEVLVATP